MEQGNRVAREQVVDMEFDLKTEVNVAAKTQDMENAIATFTETNFSSYLSLGNMDLARLRDLCQDA